MTTGHGARQVFDLPAPRPLDCGTQTRFLSRRPARFVRRSDRGYLSHYQLLPEDRLIDEGSVRGRAVCGEHRAEEGKASSGIRELVKLAPVKHMDETGFRVAGRGQWLHVASTALLTFYRVSPRRGSLLGGVGGIVVHDHWKPYFTMEGVRHALCNAHHLRELQALVEIEKEDWAGKMQRLLRRACHAVNLARERGVALKPPRSRFRRCWDAMAEGIAFHEAQPLSRARPGAGDASRAASATTFSGAFRLARKMRYAPPTIRPSRTGA